MCVVFLGVFWGCLKLGCVGGGGDDDGYDDDGEDGDDDDDFILSPKASCIGKLVSNWVPLIVLDWCSEMLSQAVSLKS